jgi:ABC-2 type transport system permease protein
MTLWRLEWTRIVRTLSAFLLPILFVFFAVLSPVMARYLPDLLDRFADQITIILPEPAPLEGLAQYLGNVEQLGLAGIIVVAAMAISFDAKRELSVFFRSRSTVTTLLAPRITVPLALGVASVWLGAFVAYLTTRVVLGPLPLAEVALGTTLYCVYLVFAVAVVVFVSSLAKPVPVVSVISIVALVLTGIFGLLPVVGDWLPSALIGATFHLAAGGGWTYSEPLLATAVLSAVLVVFGVRRLEQREI